MAQNSARKSRKSTKPAAQVETTQVGMIESTEPVGDAADAALAEVLAALNAGTDEVIEPKIETTISDEELHAAVKSAEATEVVMAAATPEGVVEGFVIPSGEGSDVPADALAAALMGDGAAETPATEAAPKKVRVPRKHYSDKVERLKDRVGDDLASYTVLTIADAGVSDEDVKKAMADTLEIIRKMNKKEQLRAGFLIEFLAGKKAKLNEVLHRVLDLLRDQGVLTTGKDGNVFANLRARPYSDASARAMGGNTVSMFADLKLIVPDGKQRYVANPDSLVLSAVRAKLDALGAAPTPEAA